MPAPLSTETRVRITSALVEGNAIRATARMVGAHHHSVMAFALRVGEGCARLHNRLVRQIAAHVLECDEQWSYVHTKASRVKDTDPSEWGDAYTYLGIDATTRLIVSWIVGKRDEAHTREFINDLRARLTVIPHLATDGWLPYAEAVRAAFGVSAIDYGQVIKHVKGGADRVSDPFDKYEPPRDVFVTKARVFGNPDLERLSTSHVERLNGTMRHMVGRKRRRCLAFSKTLRGHRAAVGLAVAAYNLTRVHGTLGTTPAVAAGLADRPWTIAELMDAALAEPEAAAPEAKPLAPRPGSAPVRQTSTGRVIRLVSANGAPVQPADPKPAPKLRPMPVQLSLWDEPEGEK